MERTEPSLVPEWLKGVGSGSSHHQDEGGQYRQRPQHSVEQESPRYSAYVPPRRVTSGSGLFASERHSESFSGNRVYPNFSRGTSYRNNHQDFFDWEKELHRGDWDLDRERLGFLGDGKDREDRANGRWPGPGRPEQEYPVRRPHSVASGSSSRPSENGEKKLVNDSNFSTGLTGTIQKAAFERNFPTLGAQEKPYSSLGNVSVLSPRHLWQHPSRSGTDGSSALETRAPNPGDSNGVGTAPVGPKMAEALVQNPPRVRTPPQISAETQRLELALKLVPMIPKSTALTSREKAKPKLSSVVTSGTSKVVQPPSSPMLSRSQSSPRPETPKLSQSKLLVLKPGVPIPDAGTASTAPATSSLLTSRNSSGGLANAAPRKQKQLLDRRAVPIPPHSATIGDPNRPRSKENGITEDKRLQAQAQNRSDFFNTIRKKAASAGGNSKVEAKSDSANNSNGVTSGEVQKLALSEVEVPNGGTSSVEPEPDDENQAGNQTANGVLPVKDPVGGSEEEEAAFLRSLGWEEDAEGGEGLTEEEINAFYQEHRHRQHNRLQNAVLNMRSAGPNNASSGISSSDSESDAEARAASNVLTSR